MHIVQIHHEKVPVKHYGGTERVIEALSKKLVDAGHKVTLISYKGDYEIENVNFIDLMSLGSRKEANENFLKLVPSDADILHFHVPFNQDNSDWKKLHYVCTLHGNESEKSKLPKNLVCISNDHAKRHGRKTFVYNGLDETEIPLNSKPLSERDYFSFLGKASLKRKGLHNAKRIARTLKTPLFVGGGSGINWRGVKYLGSVDNQKKYELLGNSKAFLFPIEWEEPFGLVMIEALFSGTPVFAFERGSVPEILGLEGGEGLFLTAQNCEELISKINHYSFDQKPDSFRRYASSHFSSQKMMEGYVEIYEKILSGQDLD